MAYYALVATLNNLRKAENSDRLYLAEVYGEGVIVGPDMIEGQKVLYLPTDGEIERWFGNPFNLYRKNEDGTEQGGYIENNSHIRAIKLRGHESSGVILPLDKIYAEFGYQGWSVGDKVNTINNVEFCRKYIPHRTTMAKTSTQKKKKTSYKGRKAERIIYPEFSMHTDTEQLAYNLDKFKPGDKINLTLKMHGTSQRSMNTYAEMPKGFFRKLFHMKPKIKQGYVLGTRRCVVTESNDGYYGSNAFRIPHHEALKPFLTEGVEVYYEVVGYYGLSETATIMPIADNTKINDKKFVKQYGKQTVFSYGCQPGESKMYIYRITSENGEKEWTPEEITAWCEEHGFNRVPVIDDFEFTTTEDLMNRIDTYFEDLTDPVGKTHIKEGVVVRIVNRPSFKAYKSKTYEFKVLSGLAAENVNTEGMSEDMLSEI